MHPTNEKFPYGEVCVWFMWLFPVAVKFPIGEAAAEKLNHVPLR